MELNNNFKYTPYKSSKIFLITSSIISVFFIIISLYWVISPLQNQIKSSNNDNSNISSKNIIEQNQIYLGQINYLKTQTINNEDLSYCFDPESSIYIVNIDTGQEIYSYNENSARSTASLSKLATALASTDYYKSNTILTSQVDRDYMGSLIGLQIGDQLSFDDSLDAMLIYSANDAAYLIGDNYSNGIKTFNEYVNNYLNDIGLQNTHFANPAGFDELNHYSTAKDLMKLTSLILKNSYLKEKISTDKTTIKITNSQNIVREVNIEARNILISEGIVNGGKTGHTTNAGDCLISYVNTDYGTIVYIVMGTSNRFETTKCLINNS